MQGLNSAGLKVYAETIAMPYVLDTAGILVLIALVLDVMWSTMGLGGGLLTKRFSNRLYRILLRIGRKRKSRLFLSWIAIIILVSVFAVWVGMLWLGWSLIFLAGERAIVQSQSLSEAGFWDRVYFTGSTIFTLGVGDFSPRGALYQFLTAFASLMGLFMITFGVTYLVPVVQAATMKRRMAFAIASIGTTGRGILLTTWNGKDFRILSEHLLSLLPNLSQLAQQHLTYPWLHYFHVRRRSESLGLGIAAMDEALTVMRFGLKEECGVPPGIYIPARRAVTQFLYMMKEAAFIEPVDKDPPIPSLDPLRLCGLPAVSKAEFESHFPELSERRRLLAALVRNERWTWELLEDEEHPVAPEKPLD
ncbi:MAG: potassium channel family protein [Syntrophales bacterium]|nr:potassium channel family protein [Syntrophales bacterium]